MISEKGKLREDLISRDIKEEYFSGKKL